ncbi:hypothetical protein O181_126037 [Austropuccinia psidii MF-1]|uniref:Reverse transcriptase/retrotransposon-derived protein RNase H-like domain-containing protein n=1 Tax=Austropuccinia psidii MF-1 TaxID=1389203 RepID=A0A9Q3KV53_9BASI|nr:hypothetical protein [Austropuccinia psidii MF-1]
MLFHVMASRWILQKFSKSSIGLSPKTSGPFNLFLALTIFIVVIKKYSKKITSLTSLLKKDSPFIFNEEALSHFQSLKEAFTTAPILSHPTPSLPTIVETDASDYGLGAVLSVTGALWSEEGPALSKLGLTYGWLKDMARKDTLKSVKDEYKKAATKE